MERRATQVGPNGVMELSLWRRVAIYLLGKVLDLLFAIDSFRSRWKRRAAERIGTSEIRDIGPSKK